MLDPPAPAAVVAALPEWLGRRPIAGETIVVGFSPMDDDLAVCVKIPPDREPADEVLAMRQLVVDGAEAVVIVDVTGAEGDPRLDATHRFLAAAAGRYGHEVIGVLLVVPPQREAPGYWRSLPEPARYPLPPSYARTESS